ncbi:hypothetical protein LCGC14_1695000, partial [marine sediment metagenome]
LPFMKWEMNGAGWDFGRMFVLIFEYPYYYRKKTSGQVVNTETKKYGWHADPTSKNELLMLYDRVMAHGGYINHSEFALEEALYYIHYSDNEPAKWFDFCPSCGTDKLDVTVTCTFLWDIFPFELENAKKQATYFEIQNEGHEEFSYNKFLKIKNECIQNFENVGRNFE